MQTSLVLRVVAAASLALIVACGGSPASPPARSPQAPSPQAHTPGPVEPLTVVTSTTVLADLIRQVGGQGIAVHPVIPAGRDVHTFEPAPSDARRLAEADLVVLNGLGLDDWLEDLAREVADDVALVALGEGLEGAEYLEGDAHGDDDHGDEHGLNPHLWLDVSNTRLYVERLTTALVALDAPSAGAYRRNAADFDARLVELDEWIKQQLASLPAENRRVVSFHDAFPYFAHAYGIEIVGVVVESPGQEPSAGAVARLIAEINEANVRAILTEVQFSDRLAQTIADEAGVAIIHELHTDSLGDPPLDTYEAVMRWNVERILEGLR